MAVNKRKILESAQKHLQKGAVDKALKEYQTLLKADPKDVNVRLKVGDLQLRLGQNEEAIEAYLKVAERFMVDGFDAKAVALYKQIGRLDAKRSEIHLPLAELYQRLGLPSDAMGALQVAADIQFKSGNKVAGLDLMRRMATLDPTNTTNRLRVAELLRQEGMLAEASAEFEAAAHEFETQGDAEGASKALEQVLAVTPDRSDLAQRLVRACITARRLPLAVQLAERAVASQPGSAESYELLADALRASGRENDLPDVYRRLAALYKERGDEERMRDVLQRFVPGAVGSSEGDEHVLETDDDLVFEEPGALELSSPDPDAAFGPDVRLARPQRQMPGRDHAREATPASRTEHVLPPLPRYDAADDTARGMQTGAPASPGLTAPPAPAPAARPQTQRPASPLAAPAATPVAPATQASAATPGAETAEAEPSEEEAAFDPDQLLAEANVYLRYGKHDRAVESLRALLVQRPEHAQALVKLGEALEAVGQRAEAVETWCSAARLARKAGHAAPFETLRARVAGLDPAAAARLDAAVATDEEFLDDVDIDIETDLGGDEAFGDPVPPAAAPKVDLDAGSPAVAERAREAEPAAIEIEIAEADVEISETELGLVEEVPEPAAPTVAAAAEPPAAAAAEPPAASRATTEEQIAAVLEEAVFYQGQGMLEEAEVTCRRILAAVPGHSLALLRLGEIESAQAALAAEAAAAQEAPETTAPVTAPAPVLRAEPPPRSEPPAARAPAPRLSRESLLPPIQNPAELCPKQDDEGEADVSDVTQNLPRTSAPQPLAAAGREQAAPAPVAATAAHAEPEPEEAGEFDLGKAISDTLAGESGPGASGRAQTDEVGIEEVFAAFKAGVERTLGAGDHEARYDLGIAYREMGLLEDALAEFRMALSGPARRLDCLHMMGLCALDLGRAADAVAHLEQALSHADVPVSQQVALRFDLARAYEGQGDAARALASYEAVAAEDPAFCDVGERLAALRGSELVEHTPEPEEEGLESFDDLMAEDAPAIADARDAADVAAPEEAMPHAEPETQPQEPETPSPAGETEAPASGPKPRTGKRKKISFF